MIRTFFFLECAIAAALALLAPLIVADFALSLALPLAAMVVIPMASALAVHPWPGLKEALGSVLNGRRPAGRRGEAEAILAELCDYAKIAAVLGFVSGLATALRRIGSGGGEPLKWALLGLWFALYGMLGALASSILGQAAARLAGRPANEDLAAEAAVEEFRDRYRITPREWEVAACIAGGASYKETADRLRITLSTVKAHLSSVYRKTGSRDKVELLLLIRRENAGLQGQIVQMANGGGPSQGGTVEGE
jgi:DNA-binding CsgD family transcriptional regulator